MSVLHTTDAALYDKQWLEDKMASDKAASKQRLQCDLQPEGHFLFVHAIPSVFTATECAEILSAVAAVTAESGWTRKRHTAYETTDIPSAEVPTVDSWVRKSINERVFTKMAQLFDLGPEYML